MSICLVYDDRTPVSDDIRALLGVERFSAVLYRKRSLLDHVRQLMQEADVAEFIHLSRDADLDLLRRHAERASPGARYLYYPSHIVPRRLADARLFISKIQYSRRDLIIPVDDDPGAPAVLLLGERGLRRALEHLARPDWVRLRRASGRGLAEVGNAAELSDIASYDRFVEFLSSNFDVRHFNAIEHDGLTIVKRSSDRDKMRREFRFLSMVEGPVQAFFLRPFDYRDEPDGASYRIERLNVPDMAVQWIHGALSAPEFGTFLDRIGLFLQMRSSKEIPRETFAALTDDLYLNKIASRLDQLRAMDGFAPVRALIEHCTGLGSLESLVGRYQGLYRRLDPGRRIAPHLRFTHGDLCFSNILYDKRVRQIRFIDPRGADSPDELLSHPYYDLAKLSHSVLGGYDLINQNLFELTFDRDLGLSLETAGPDHSQHKRVFIERLATAGADYPVVRLFEASLFLSMLPLHMDVPKKVAAFVLNASAILDELENLTG